MYSWVLAQWSWHTELCISVLFGFKVNIHTCFVNWIHIEDYPVAICEQLCPIQELCFCWVSRLGPGLLCSFSLPSTGSVIHECSWPWWFDWSGQASRVAWTVCCWAFKPLICLRCTLEIEVWLHKRGGRRSLASESYLAENGVSLVLHFSSLP